MGRFGKAARLSGDPGELKGQTLMFSGRRRLDRGGLRTSDPKVSVVGSPLGVRSARWAQPRSPGADAALGYILALVAHRGMGDDVWDVRGCGRWVTRGRTP